VLDIEPSKAQIQQAGGPERLFREIRTWLRMVEHRAGVKPILYVNQMFVNNYLSKQPDLKRDYRVWIARYSEFKPDVRLTFWQLCSDGRVAGIKGDVDINVFNGYKNQYEEFIKEETIK
jgi:lysozyme